MENGEVESSAGDMEVEASAGNKTGYGWSVAALALVLVGLLARLVVAWFTPPNTDEGFTYQLTRCDIPHIVEVLRRDSHPPTHNILFHPLVQLTDSLFVLRLPELLGGALAVYVCFLLGERGRRGWGWPCAALYALSYTIITSDMQFRSYGLLGLAIWTTIYLSLNVHEWGHPWKRDSKLAWLCYGLCALMTASLHFTGTLVVGVIWAMALVCPRSWSALPKLKVLMVLGAAMIPVGSWLIDLTRVGSNHMVNVHCTRCDFMPLVTVFNYMCGLETWPLVASDLLSPWGVPEESFLRIAYYVLWALAILMWLIACRGMRALWRGNLGLLCLMTLPWLALLTGLMVSSWRLVQAFTPRHLIPLAPVLFLWLAAGLNRNEATDDSPLPQADGEAGGAKAPKTSLPLWSKVLLGIILGLNVLAVGLVPVYPKLRVHADVVGIKSFVAAHAQGPAVILVMPSFEFFNFSWQYSEGAMNYDFSRESIVTAPDYVGPEILPLQTHLMMLAQGTDILRGKQVFLLMGNPGTDFVDDDSLAKLNETYGVADTYSEPSLYLPLTIYYLQKR